MKYVIATLLIFLSLTTVSFSAAESFSRNLSVGMRGGDVRELQKFLNRDTETRIANAGAGSPGSETDYFGLATKRALVKFQEKYEADILAPVGLNSGTGFFGEKTREKVNTLLRISLVEDTPPLEEVPKLAVEQGKVFLMFPSQYSGAPGTTISISGAGFTPMDNTIYFGTTHAVTNASSVGGQSITFKVPNIPKGVYALSVENSRGESNKEQWFIVTDGISPHPKIEKLDPAIVLRGETVVISGAGFLPEKNTIMVSGVGLFENVPSVDGVSVSFVVPRGAFPVTFSPKVEKRSFSISVRVLNENGISNLGKLILTP